MEYIWWTLLIGIAGALAYFSSTAIVGEQRRLEWESFAREHQCKQSQVDPKVWSCMSPTPAWFEIK